MKGDCNGSKDPLRTRVNKEMKIKKTGICLYIYIYIYLFINLFIKLVCSFTLLLRGSGVYMSVSDGRLHTSFQVLLTQPPDWDKKQNTKTSSLTTRITKLSRHLFYCSN